MTTTENNYDACLDALLLCSGQLFPAILNAAIELNLFEIIGEGSSNNNKAMMSASEIASKLAFQNPNTSQKLDRMLYCLSAHSLLICSKRFDEDGKIERVYGISHTGKHLLANEDGASYVAFSRMMSHPALTLALQNLKEVIVDDEEDLFKKVHGMPKFEYMETDPTYKALFHRAMADISAMQMREILKIYKGYEGITTLVDVAGGIGQSLKMITSKYPSIKGINFDLPQVVQHAPSYPGITHVGGDMFEGVPQGDAIMIKNTTHNWSDEKCMQILKNCFKSLKEGGKLIIIELLMPDIAKVSDGDKYVSLIGNLMFLHAGGKERSEKELAALCKHAGFSRYQIACYVFSTVGVIEFYK